MNDRRRVPFASRRSFTFFIVVALLVGVGLATAGFVARGGGDEVVLVVDQVTAEATPSTVAPRSGPVKRRSIPSEEKLAEEKLAEEPSPDGAGSELSPLADLVGERFSAIPADVEPRPRPVKLQIDSIDVARFPVRAVGLELDGQLEVPDETEIGWYQYGATAGQRGATVLAAHVSWNRTSGPFARLGAVDPGAQIEVTLDDGSVRRYEVTERALYGKLELPRERIWRTTGDETLVLITCGGDYNPDVRRYRENIVVYAVPVA